MLTGVRAAAGAVVLVVTAAVTLVLYGPIPMASAHAQLLSSDPAEGATVPTPPAAVSLTFSDPIDRQFVRVAWEAPRPAHPPFEIGTSGPTVTVGVPASGPGGYRLTYRVVSADGHPVSGRLSFTVVGTPAASSGGSPATSPGASPATSPEVTAIAGRAPGPAADEPAADDAGNTSAAGWASALVAILVAATAVVGLAVRRRRAGGMEGPSS